MRLTADLIGDDHDERTGRAIYLLLAEQIAGQALALAAYRGETVTADNVHRLVSTVTGYPGVEMRRIPDTSMTIGDRAVERLISLANAAMRD